MSGRLSFENLKNNKPIGSQRAGIMPSLQHLSGNGRYEQYKMGGMNYSTLNRVKGLVKQRKLPVKDLDNNQFLSDYRGKAAAARADDIMNQVVATEVLRAREAFNKGLRGPRLSGLVGSDMLDFGRTLQGANQMFPTDGNWRIATINNPAFRNQVAAQWFEPGVEAPVRVPDIMNRDMAEERRQRNRHAQAVGNNVLNAYLRENFGNLRLPEGEGIRLPRREPPAPAPPQEAEIDIEEYVDVPAEQRGENAVAAIQRRFREARAQERARARIRRANPILDDAFDLGPMEGQTAAAGPAANIVRRRGNEDVEDARDAAEDNQIYLGSSAATANTEMVLADATLVGSTFYEMVNNTAATEQRAQAAAIPRTNVLADPSMLTPVAGGGMDANPIGTNSITPVRARDLVPPLSSRTVDTVLETQRATLAGAEAMLQREIASGGTPESIARLERMVESERNMTAYWERKSRETPAAQARYETVRTMLTTPTGMPRRLEGMQSGSLVEPTPYGFVKRELEFGSLEKPTTPSRIDEEELAAFGTVVKAKTPRSPDEEELAAVNLIRRNRQSEKELARLRRLQRELGVQMRGVTPPEEGTKRTRRPPGN